MSKGLVSVIIPVYNGEHFLREAVPVKLLSEVTALYLYN